MNDNEIFQNYHQPKPCMFCPNMAGYTPLEEMEVHGARVYFCYNCNAEYIHFRDGVRASISLYTTVNDKMYRWTVTSSRTAQLWYVKEPGIPGVKRNKDMVPIKAFDGPPIPDLNPVNVSEKIRVWLPFL